MPRIKIGVVGCGLIAQMMHLPHLRELADSYDVVALCDVSPATLKYVGDHHGIGAATPITATCSRRTSRLSRSSARTPMAW
jgi:predicted dehydrogenase